MIYMGEESKYAPYYDITLYPFLRGVRREVTRTVVELGPQRILDICCGTGNQLKYLKKKGFDGIGIDLDPAMLKQAKKGRHPVSCQMQDATNISFPSESFDLAIIEFAIHEKPAVVARKMLKEAHRVLKKDGYLLIVDFSIDHRTWCAARRTIDYIESRAGGEHYANFRKYCASGGLDTLIPPGFKVERNKFMAFNGLVLRILKKA